MEHVKRILDLIASEERRVTEPEAVGALANIRNAINAMEEEDMSFGSWQAPQWPNTPEQSLEERVAIAAARAAKYGLDPKDARRIVRAVIPLVLEEAARVVGSFSAVAPDNMAEVNGEWFLKEITAGIRKLGVGGREQLISAFQREGFSRGEATRRADLLMNE